MRASVTDVDILTALQPANVLAYLRAHGWTLYSQAEGRFSVWINSHAQDAEIIVPVSKKVTDYASLFSQALKELEAIEERSQIEIVRDLMNSGYDVVRLSAHSSSTQDGTVRIQDGLRLFERAKDILLASACAAVNPRPVFHSRKPAQANEYLERAKFGQTEKGSFVITMLSPITPHLPISVIDEILPPEDPFERAVTRTLIGGLSGMVNAAETASVLGDFEHFQTRVKEGVSANLCEATADLFNASEVSRINVGITWALNRPAPEATPSQISISTDIVPLLEEAARQFRARDNLDGYVVQGAVVKLERDEGATLGRATVLAEIEGSPRRVLMQLHPSDYELAMKAHSNYKPIRVVGNVRKEGRSYNLTNPTGLTIAYDLDERDIFG